VLVLLLGGCVFDRGGVTADPQGGDGPVGEDAGDIGVIDGAQDLDGRPSLDGGRADVTRDAPPATDADLGPQPDGPPSPDGPAPDGPLPPDLFPPDTLQPDTLPTCPATCAIACLPGTATCPQPANVVLAQLPAPCGAVTVPAGATWRLCSNTGSSCRLVAGTDCNASPGCAGKALDQTIQAAGNTIPACVFTMPALTVDAGATLQVRGDSPAILVVEGTALIAGTVDVSAQGGYGGAGGGDGGQTNSGGKGSPGTGPIPGVGGGTCDCQTNEDNYDDCAGGGGGFATVGGAGGLEGGQFCSVGPQPVGGQTYGNQALIPLLGGSGGGAGDVGNAAQANPGNGGGGGGALQISASAIELSGAILANGGPGKGGASWSTDYPGGGGGGGSGGGILLEAATFAGSGWTMAAGGGGGGGGDGCTADDGQQAKLVNNAEQLPAGGKDCSSGGDGGDGAYGAPVVQAQPGQNAGIWEGPGGGGGGAGYLRFNHAGPSATCPPGYQTSGSVSCGTMAVQ
jgi:hypothetical protein